jgi:hypothetical protein
MSGEASSGIEVLSFTVGPCRDPRHPAIGICLTLMLIIPKTSYHKLISRNLYPFKHKKSLKSLCPTRAIPGGS